jgi:hypothetical protein
VVVEVKTTEVYAVKTSTLAGYVDALISEKIIPDREHALGLYVVGRTDPEINQLENAILAEKRTQHMRIISVDSLLSLAEMMTDYDVSHPDALALLRPSGPRIDQVVDLMARLVAQGKMTPVEEQTGSTRPADRLTEEQVAEPLPTVQTAYWLTPVRTDETRTAEECIQTLVGQEKLYAFGERTPGRKRIKPGDWICFYATAKGVVAHAKVATSPEKKAHPEVGEDYPWIFSLESPKLYLDRPVAIDAAMRNQLNVFKGRDPEKSWAWFVQATREISEHDFHLLTANP